MTPPAEPAAAATVAELLERRADDDAPGLRWPGGQASWRAVVAESARRADLLGRLAWEGPPHLGVLLGNVPEYLYWLGGAALAGATVVGVNPTRRGGELARDVRFTDCGLIVTDGAGAALLDGLDLGLPAGRCWRVDDAAAAARLGAGDPAWRPDRAPGPGALYLLLFTSGTTGDPKAVRCTQGRLAAIAERAASGYGFSRRDVCYCPMPLFHGNAVMALWAPALAVGATVALPPRFSASGFLDDVRRFGATRFTYVGRALAYVLATPERPDDADNPLQVGFGTEASAPDRLAFERRFGLRLVEGYGSSEGGAAVQVTPDTPPGALGPGSDDVVVCDPATGRECPRARLDPTGRLLNAAEAVGEIVNRAGAGGFEGYYKNPAADAERVRDGWYWTGDLGYRDEAGWLYFAGRSGDWLRVDSENFAAAPIERILGRQPEVAGAAVYGVPDPRTGDRVMAAVELRPGAVFDPGRFAEHLDAQPDLGTKWRPSFVRVVAALPVTATGKVTKTALRRERWRTADPVWWRGLDDRAPYALMGPADVDALEAAFDRHGRRAQLDT